MLLPSEPSCLTFPSQFGELMLEKKINKEKSLKSLAGVWWLHAFNSQGRLLCIATSGEPVLQSETVSQIKQNKK